MNRITIYLPKGQFYRVCQLHYAWVQVPVSIPIAKGDFLLIACDDYRGDCELETVLVREIIDFDVVDRFSIENKEITVIIRNNNYLS